MAPRWRTDRPAGRLAAAVPARPVSLADPKFLRGAGNTRFYLAREFKDAIQ